MEERVISLRKNGTRTISLRKIKKQKVKTLIMFM